MGYHMEVSVRVREEDVQRLIDALDDEEEADAKTDLNDGSVDLSFWSVGTDFFDILLQAVKAGITFIAETDGPVDYQESFPPRVMCASHGEHSSMDTLNDTDEYYVKISKDGIIDEDHLQKVKRHLEFLKEVEALLSGKEAA